MTDRTAPAKEASGEVTDELIEQCLQHVRSFEAIGGTGAYPFSVRLAKRVLSQHAELSRRSSPVREQMKNQERILPTVSKASMNKEDLPLEDARQEHIEMMVKAAADWLVSDDSAYELDPLSARRAAWGMLQAAFSVVPGPNVVKGPVDTRGGQDAKR